MLLELLVPMTALLSGGALVLLAVTASDLARDLTRKLFEEADQLGQECR